MQTAWKSENRVGAGFTFTLLARRNEGSFEGSTLSFEGSTLSFEGSTLSFEGSTLSFEGFTLSFEGPRPSFCTCAEIVKKPSREERIYTILGDL